MLLSRRLHPTFTASQLSMDRAIAPGFVLRRVTLRGIAQDERLSAQVLGVDRPRRRHGLAVVLEGLMKEQVDGRELHVAPGSVLFAPAGTTRGGLCSGEVLELDWDARALGDSAAPAAAVFTLGARSRRAALALSSALASARSAREVEAPLLDFLRALACAESLAIDPEVVRGIASTTPEEQALHDCVDAQLCALDRAPMFVDFEGALPVSRRTISRRLRELHARYKLPGGASWRAMRDHYRLVIASILLSHAEATPRAVASMVGYGSVEALDHAFRHAGMTSPSAFRRAVLAA